MMYVCNVYSQRIVAIYMYGGIAMYAMYDEVTMYGDRVTEHCSY